MKTTTSIKGFWFEQYVTGADDRGAVFSPDQRYRYVLWRHWGAGARPLVVIGLNPSTADAQNDDPTIRRCIGFAKRERCDGLVMLNLFALRATDPTVMLAHPQPIGAENDAYIRRYANDSKAVVVAAWGTDGEHRGRGAAVRRTLPAMLCLGMTKDGHPRHPLYLRRDQPLVPFTASSTR